MTEPSLDDATSRRAGVGILRLSGPLVVSFVLRSAFAWIDLIFAAMLDKDLGGGDASRAAITLTLPFEFMMIACWVGASNGLTARLGAAMGARQGQRIEQLKRAAKRIINALCVLFLLLALLLWFKSGVLTPKGDALVTRQFQIYATVLLGGSAFTSFWSILPDSLVKVHHDTRSTMWAGLLSGFTNVALNALFMFVFHWGMFGIALSTVLGRLAGLAFALGRARHHERLRIGAGADSVPGLYPRPVRAILAIAGPAAATMLLMSVESLTINQILKGTSDPVSALAAWGVFDQAARFMAMPLIACAVALLPLVARAWGQRDCRAIRSELRTALLAGGVYVLIVVTPVAFGLGAWVADELSNDEHARVFAEVGLRYLPLAVAAMSPLFLLRSVFDGMQRPLPGLIVSSLRSLLLVIPLTYLGTRAALQLGHDQILGAYVGFILGVGLSSAIFSVWVRRALQDGE